MSLYDQLQDPRQLRCPPPPERRRAGDAADAAGEPAGAARACGAARPDQQRPRRRHRAGDLGRGARGRPHRRLARRPHHRQGRDPSHPRGHRSLSRPRRRPSNAHARVVRRRDVPGLEGQVRLASGGAAQRLVGGRATRTVFYRHTHHRIGYTVISGEPLKPPPAPSGSSSMASRCTAIATGATPSSRSCATAIRACWPVTCTSPARCRSSPLGTARARSGSDVGTQGAPASHPVGPAHLKRAAALAVAVDVVADRGVAGERGLDLPEGLEGNVSQVSAPVAWRLSGGKRSQFATSMSVSGFAGLNSSLACTW